MNNNEENTPSIYKERLPSIQVVRRNIPNILCFFPIAHLPVYLLSILIGNAGSASIYLKAAVIDAPSMINFQVTVLPGELALIFTAICLVFIITETVQGRDARIGRTLQTGMDFLAGYFSPSCRSFSQRWFFPGFPLICIPHPPASPSSRSSDFYRSPFSNYCSSRPLRCMENPDSPPINLVGD